MMTAPPELIPLPDTATYERAALVGDPPRILVVDDDKGFRERLRDFLLDDGFDVVGEAPDGVEAVTAAGRLRPDVIVMDMRMPRMGGLEATRRIKNAIPETQVVILSAYEDRALKRGAEELGVYGYLIKGCPPSLLVDTLRFAWSFKKGSVHARVHPFEPSGGLESSP